MAKDSTTLYNVTAAWEPVMNGSNEYNATGNATCSWLEDLSLWTEIQPVVLGFLTIFGIAENVFILSVLWFHKSRCTVAEIYLANLAIADLLLLCGLPFWAVNIANRFKWPFGLVLCKAVNSIMSWNMYSSIYFLVMVSIDRYLALVKTMSLGRMRRPRCAKLNCLVIWIVALLLCFPVLTYRSVDPVPECNTTMCILAYPGPQWQVFTNTMLNTVGFLMPLCIITFCTIQIIRAFQNSEIHKIKGIQTEKKATILIFVVLLLFVICWLPFQITTLLDTLQELKIISDLRTMDAIHVASQIAAYCSISNSCLNPIVYVIVGKHFRKKSKEVYCGSYHRRPSTIPSVLQTVTSLETLRTSISVGQHRKKSAIN